jgi:hypothetical protein
VDARPGLGGDGLEDVERLAQGVLAATCDHHVGATLEQHPRRPEAEEVDAPVAAE